MIPTLRLPCGAALAAEAAEGARSFAAGFWFPMGSRHEAPRERGFVHFVEHMAFKGTAAAERRRHLARDRPGRGLPQRLHRPRLDLLPLPGARRPLGARPRRARRHGLQLRLQGRGLRARARGHRQRDPLRQGRSRRNARNDEFLVVDLARRPALAQDRRGARGYTPHNARRALRLLSAPSSRPRASSSRPRGRCPPADVAEELSRAPRGRMRAGLGATALGGSSPRRRAEATPAFSPVVELAASPIWSRCNYYEAVQLEPPFAEADYYALAALNGAHRRGLELQALPLPARGQGPLLLGLQRLRDVEDRVPLGGLGQRVRAPASRRSPRRWGRLLDELADGRPAGEECVDAIGRLAGSFDLALEDTDFRMRRIARQVLFSGEAMTAEEARAAIARLGPAELNAMRERLLGGR